MMIYEDEQKRNPIRYDEFAIAGEEDNYID